MQGHTDYPWKDIKHHFFETGSLPNPVLADSPIIQGWQKSRQAGLSPLTKVSDLSDFPHAALTDSDQYLAELAQPILQDTWKIFGQQDISIFLINQQRKIIAEQHNDFAHQSYSFLQTGRIVDEAVFGAIAPTCSLSCQQPLIMVGHQHYLDEFSEYSCASVPIFDGQGGVLGALDITSRQGLLASNWLRHLLYQTYKLENQLLIQQSEQHLLVFQHSPDLLSNAYSAMLEYDDLQIIRKANQMALKLLNRNIHDVLGQPLQHFFLTPMVEQSGDFLIQSCDHALFYARQHRPMRQVISNQSIRKSAILQQQQLQQAVKAIQANIPILITGETGTGKEHFAQQIRQQFPQDLPFISINCGAIPENLLESELFGYEGGAFTGAKQKGEKGLVELADQGFLFLDEIGDLPMHLQVKVLRVLQDQQFYRVGGRQPIQSKFRLICATNQDLPTQVKQQQFRSDLYYRIRGYEVQLLPLRQRSDKLVLMQNILQELGIQQWSAQVEQQLEQYDWQGNIRELIHVLKLSVALSEQPILEQLYLPERSVSAIPEQISARPADLEQQTSQLIQQVLQQEQGNVSKTAKRLNISRTTVYKYLH